MQVEGSNHTGPYWKRFSKDGRTPKKLIVLSSLLFLISGCSVQDRKNGQSENVQLRTPIGALAVRTNEVHAADLGLPSYPGAVQTVKHGDDSGSADIDMSFGKWQLHVKAIEYRSGDPGDKIVAFYKNALSQYGDVLTCKDKVAVGEPTHTRQGLTCADDHGYHVDMQLDTSHEPLHGKTPQISGNVKLLAGSPQDQHIVEVHPSSDGTKFSLVVVHLPHNDQTD